MISEIDIEHLKDLARVEFGELETGALIYDMSSILDYVATLKEANVENVPEMTHALDMQNIVRSDENIDFTNEVAKEKIDAIIKAFPEKDEAYLKVKAIF